MSAVPARPSRPDRRSSVAASSAGGIPTCSASQRTSPGSTLPERVAMTSPSSGVNPMVVSTERPSRTAASDAPAPRWQVTTRRPSASPADDLRRPSRGIRVREPVEAVPAEVPALAPLGRERVGERRGRERGVEGRVEAGDGRHLREHGGHRGERGQGLRLVQRREVRQGLEPLDDARVDPHGTREDRPAVDDPVADGVDRAQAADGALELRGIRDAARCRQVGAALDRVAGAEHPQLEAGGARVDDEDPAGHPRLIRPVMRRQPSRRPGPMRRPPAWSALSPRRTASPSSRSRARPRPRPACTRGPRCACPPSAGGRGRPWGRGRGPGR